MSKLDIMTLDGTTKEQIEVPTPLAVEPKKVLLHQAVVMYLANLRQTNAHTKTRGEIRGGGRKPWKQKGTGRARAGSSRSPLWIGGGITFGPRSEQNYTKRMPKAMKQLALSMALSSKIQTNSLVVVDELQLKTTKTKDAVKIILTLIPEARSILIVTATIQPELIQATRNVPFITVTTTGQLNTYNVLSFEKLLLTKEAVTVLAKQLGKE